MAFASPVPVVKVPRTYDVVLDLDTLRSCAMAQGGTGYSVRLTGAVDARWLESYCLLRGQLPRLARFYLSSKMVLFACPPGDDLSLVLGMLIDFIELTNRHASSAGFPPPPESEDPAWTEPRFAPTRRA